MDLLAIFFGHLGIYGTHLRLEAITAAYEQAGNLGPRDHLGHSILIHPRLHDEIVRQIAYLGVVHHPLKCHHGLIVTQWVRDHVGQDHHEQIVLVASRHHALDLTDPRIDLKPHQLRRCLALKSGRGVVRKLRHCKVHQVLQRSLRLCWAVIDALDLLLHRFGPRGAVGPLGLCGRGLASLFGRDAGFLRTVHIVRKGAIIDRPRLARIGIDRIAWEQYQTIASFARSLAIVSTRSASHDISRVRDRIVGTARSRPLNGFLRRIERIHSAYLVIDLVNRQPVSPIAAQWIMLIGLRIEVGVTHLLQIGYSLLIKAPLLEHRGLFVCLQHIPSIHPLRQPDLIGRLSAWL